MKWLPSFLCALRGPGLFSIIPIRRAAAKAEISQQKRHYCKITAYAGMTKYSITVLRGPTGIQQFLNLLAPRLRGNDMIQGDVIWIRQECTR